MGSIFFIILGGFGENGSETSFFLNSLHCLFELFFQRLGEISRSFSKILMQFLNDVAPFFFLIFLMSDGGQRVLHFGVYDIVIKAQGTATEPIVVPLGHELQLL